MSVNKKTIHIDDVTKLSARLQTIVEATVPSEKQHAAKMLVKNVVWDTLGIVEDESKNNKVARQ